MLKDWIIFSYMTILLCCCRRILTTRANTFTLLVNVVVKEAGARCPHTAARCQIASHSCLPPPQPKNLLMQILLVVTVDDKAWSISTVTLNEGICDEKQKQSFRIGYICKEELRNLIRVIIRCERIIIL